MDKDKRARYDSYGHAGVDPSFGAGGFDFRRDFTHAEDIEDIFGSPMDQDVDGTAGEDPGDRPGRARDTLPGTAADGATGQPVSLTLTWSAVSGAAT